jgi:ferric hydroxamate transport system substrate-binding protein
MLAGATGMVAAALPAWAAAPTRIVSLDYGIASTLLALGVVPVAIGDLADWDKWMGEPKMPAGVIDLGSAGEANFEILAMLKPDLIITTPYLDDNFERLKALAPVLRLDLYSPATGPILPAAIAATRRLGDAIGQRPEAESYLAEAEALFDDCKQRLSRLDPPPLALINFLDARHARIYGAPGLFDNVLVRIGLTNAWPEPSNYWGFQTIAIEDLSRISARNARLIAFEPIPGDVLPKLDESPLWQKLPFARPGHFSILPPTLMFGMVNEAMRLARLITNKLEADA